MIIITVVAVVEDETYYRVTFAPTIHFKFITKCDSFFITKCEMYNKVRQFYYKVRQNKRSSSPVSSLFAE